MAHENAKMIAKHLAANADLGWDAEPFIDRVSRTDCEDNEVCIEMSDGSVYSVQVLEVRGPRSHK